MREIKEWRKTLRLSTLEIRRMKSGTYVHILRERGPALTFGEHYLLEGLI